MNAKRVRRWIVIASAVGIAAGLGVSVWLSWGQIVELRYLIGLAGLDDASRAARIERLAEVGGERTARALADLVDPESGSSPWTAKDFPPDLEYLWLALEKVLERSDAEAVTAVGEALRARVVATSLAYPQDDEHLAPLMRVVLALAESRPDFAAGFLRDVERSDGLLAESAGRVFWLAHRDDAERGFALLTSASFVGFTRLCPASIGLSGEAWESWAPRRAGVFEAVEKPTVRVKVLTRVAKEHPVPEVRALALAYCVLGMRADMWGRGALRALEFAWESDPAPVVRRAALRLTGATGTGLDLRSVLLSKSDPQWLVEIVRARDAWCGPHRDRIRGVDLWDGFPLEIPESRKASGLELLDARERARLRELLATRHEPDLRDAIATLLANERRARGDGLGPDVNGDETRSGLRVVEWSVWRDTGDTTVREESLRDGLPEFVESAAVAAAVEDFPVARERLRGLTTIDGSVRFLTEAPTEALVRVAFFRGAAWATFPASTHEFRVPWESWSGPPSDAGRGLAPRSESDESDEVYESRGSPYASSLGRETLALAAERRSFDPGSRRPRRGDPVTWADWDLDGEVRAAAVSTSGTVHPGDFWGFRCRMRTSLGPNWLRFQREFAQPGRRVAEEAESLGVEWCGVRVAPPAELEAELPLAPAGSRWERSRSGTSARVSLGAASERFLGYRGAVDVPGPVVAAWQDESKDAVILGVRGCDDLAKSPPLIESRRKVFGRSFTPGPLREMPALPAVLVVERDSEARIRGGVIEELEVSRLHRDVRRVALGDLTLDEDDLRDRLRTLVESQGATREEAAAFVDAWWDDLTGSAGVSVLTLLPREYIDAVLPLDVLPLPDDLARVAVVVREVADIADGVASLGLELREELFPRRFWRAGLELPVDTRDRVELPEPAALVRGEGGSIASPSGAPFGQPTISPAGDLVAFVAAIDGEHSFLSYLADLSRGTILDLTDVAPHGRFTIGGSAGPSTDSISVTRLRARRSRFARVQIVDRARERAVVVDGFQALSGDGSRVLFRGDTPSELRRLDLATGMWRTVFTGDAEGCAVGAALLDGDGSHVAFDHGSSESSDVFLIDVEGSRLIEVSRHAADDRLLGLSRDGRRVLFLSDRRRWGELWLADLDRDEIAPLEFRSDAFAGRTPEESGELLFVRIGDARHVAVDIDARVARELDDVKTEASVAARPGGYRAVWVGAATTASGESRPRLEVRDYEW